MKKNKMSLSVSNPNAEATERWSVQKASDEWHMAEALIIYSIHEHNRRIHKYLYVFMKFKEIIVTSLVS